LKNEPPLFAPTALKPAPPVVPNATSVVPTAVAAHWSMPPFTTTSSPAAKIAPADKKEGTSPPTLSKREILQRDFPGLLDVGRVFECASCLGLQVESTALVPCGHSFCRVCVVRSKQCPLCLEAVATTVANMTLDQTIEALANAVPEAFQEDDIAKYRDVKFRSAHKKQRARANAVPKHTTANTTSPVVIAAAAAAAAVAANVAATATLTTVAVTAPYAAPTAAPAPVVAAQLDSLTQDGVRTLMEDDPPSFQPVLQAIATRKLGMNEYEVCMMAKVKSECCFYHAGFFYLNLFY